MKGLWFVVSLLLAIPALGQIEGEASKQFAAGNERLTNYQPPNASDRMKWFVVSTAGPLSLLAAGPISAGFSTAINRTKEYGPHWEGFGERYGMRLTGVSTGNAIEASLGSLWGEDPRYFPSPRRGFGTRVKYVIKTTFWRRAAMALCIPHTRDTSEMSGTTFCRIHGAYPTRTLRGNAALRAAWGSGTNVGKCVRRVLAGCGREFEEIGESDCRC
jgi:hypothetical protein